MRPDQAPTSRLLPLDGLRGVAILMVLLFHIWRVPAGAGIAVPALGRAIENFASIGWTGVQLFFVLSGFLITGVLLDARAARNYFRVFYARRVLRLFPLYYLTLIAFFWLWPLLSRHVAFFRLHGQPAFPASEQLWYWFDLVNLRTAFFPLIVVMLTHCWTLSLEEQFYAVWPVVVRHLRERSLVAMAVAVIALSPLLRALPWVQRMNAAYPNFTYRLTPFNLDTLLTGALLAVLWRHADRARLCRVASAVFPLALAGLWLWGSSDPSRGVLAPTVTALLFGALLLLSLTLRPAAAFFALAPLRAMGKYSYSVYLLHPLVIYWFNVPMGHLLRGRLLLPGHPYAGFLVGGVLQIAACFLVARATWVLIESPMLRRKRRLRYELPAPDDPSLPVEIL